MVEEFLDKQYDEGKNPESTTMSQPLVSRKRAQAISSALFLLSLATLIYTDQWWPGILLGIGLPLALRQYLLGRTYDMIISLVVFIGGFITVGFDISWQLLLPILFVLASVYVVLREFMDTGDSEADREEDLNHELEEKKRKK